MSDYKSLLEQKPDYLVCICMDVTRFQIEAAIQAGYRDFQSLSDFLGVGTGCSSCVEEVHDILRELLQKSQN